MAVVATKIHAHGLTRTTTGLSGHYCDGCRATLVGESYRCGPCNFDLCGACFGKNKSTQPTRVHAHPVTYTNTGLDRHYCDVCSAATTREAWRCASCNFDVCTTCFDTLSAPKPAAVARPAAAATAAAAEVKAPLTVAQHAHPLVSTSGLSGHFCDGCKGAVSAQSYRCAPCNWDLCAACYTKSNQRISRLHAHPITHTTTGLELHYCDGCRAPTETESWRCSECNFDLCKECTTRSSAPKATEVKAAAAAPAAAAAAAAPATAATELKCHPHALTRTTHGLKGHHCDGCRASPLSVSFRCNECNFDLCSACNESTHKQSLSLHPHAVQWTTVGLAGHYCNVCRVVMEGPHPQAWRCNGCDFDVCQACVTRTKAPKPVPAARPAVAPAAAATTEVKAEPVMTKAHQHGLLRTTTGLSGHHCDGCRATGLAVAHRCNSCDFDLCESCFSRNRLAHTSRMHAHPLAFARGLREHWCDDCRAPCTSAWRCDDCNFDLCLGCFARAKLPKQRPVAAAPVAVAAAPVAVAAVAARPAVAEVKVERHGVKGHAHPVSMVSSGLTGHFCDSCNASPLTSAYRCHECNYDVCSGCFDAARTEVSSRVHTHPLRWTSGLEAHYCDVCRKTATEMYRCDSCNFDCCTTCLRAAQAPVAAVAAPSAPAAPVAAAPVAAAPAAAFWSCSACTYVNPALASTCYICSTSKA